MPSIKTPGASNLGESLSIQRRLDEAKRAQEEAEDSSGLGTNLAIIFDVIEKLGRVVQGAQKQQGGAGGGITQSSGGNVIGNLELVTQQDITGEEAEAEAAQKAAEARQAVLNFQPQGPNVPSGGILSSRFQRDPNFQNALGPRRALGLAPGGDPLSLLLDVERRRGISRPGIA